MTLPIRSLAIAILVALSSLASAADAARHLRRLVGYTIIHADTVSNVFTGEAGNKHIKTMLGYTLKVQLLILDPLPITDIVILGRKVDIPSSPSGSFTMYKVLVDNEVFDCEIIKTP